MDFYNLSKKLSFSFYVKKWGNKYNIFFLVYESNPQTVYTQNWFLVNFFVFLLKNSV